MIISVAAISKIKDAFLKFEGQERRLGIGLLFGSSLLGDSLFGANVGGLKLLSISHPRPVVLGLGHGVSQSHTLQPGASLFSSTLGIPVRKVLELESLLDIHGVIVLLTLTLSGTDLLVLSLCKARRNVRRIGQLSLLQLQDQTVDRISLVKSRCINIGKYSDDH